ncbi:MAG: peptidylprolyl isomerase [Nitrospiraceae bacterium]
MGFTMYSHINQRFSRLLRQPEAAHADCPSRRQGAWRRRGIVLLMLTGLLCGGFASSVLSGHLEDRIVAVVNTELIMLSEMKHEIGPEQVRIKKQFKGEELARRLKLAEYMALTKMIERKLQLQAAQKKGVDVSDQEVQQAAEEMKRQGEKIDVSNPQQAKDVKDQLTLLKVVDREVRSGIMVAESEMRRYYQEHQDRFALPEEYTLSQILIRIRGPEDTTEARAKAKDILAGLKQGAQFEDLALRRSDGPNASRGGKLGLVRQGELHPPIERAISPLQIGDISDIVETSEGLHIIRVEEKKPRQFRPFEEVRNEIQGLVFQQKSEDIYQIWMAELKNKAYIEVKF